VLVKPVFPEAVEAASQPHPSYWKKKSQRVSSDQFSFLVLLSVDSL
jgi:hypothetical protein